jgi:hypothetical protein
MDNASSHYRTGKGWGLIWFSGVILYPKTKLPSILPINTELPFFYHFRIGKLIGQASITGHNVLNVAFTHLTSFSTTGIRERPIINIGSLKIYFITVFTVFRLLTDFVCLYTYEF